jgi:hypothetical protein
MAIAIGLPSSTALSTGTKGWIEWIVPFAVAPEPAKPRWTSPPPPPIDWRQRRADARRARRNRQRGAHRQLGRKKKRF